MYQHQSSSNSFYVSVLQQFRQLLCISTTAVQISFMYQYYSSSDSFYVSVLQQLRQLLCISTTAVQIVFMCQYYNSSHSFYVSVLQQFKQLLCISIAAVQIAFMYQYYSSSDSFHVSVLKQFRQLFKQKTHHLKPCQQYFVRALNHILLVYCKICLAFSIMHLPPFVPGFQQITVWDSEKSFLSVHKNNFGF